MTLFIVATPIGNLDDISLRATEALRQADRVLAEDTRRARQLLSHLAIEGKAVERLDAEVESRDLSRFVAALDDGKSLALVSDAGAPAVSDPGAGLVRAAVAAGHVVVPIPGPSAVTAAMMASGFAGGFRFFGFLPRGGSERRAALAAICDTPETVILFESAKRCAATIEALYKLMPDRQAMVARELTKLHEECVRGSLRGLHAERQWRGEITIVLGPYEKKRVKISEQVLDAHIDELARAGRRAKDIAQALSLDSGWTSREIYQRISDRK